MSLSDLRQDMNHCKAEPAFKDIVTIKAILFLQERLLSPRKKQLYVKSFVILLPSRVPC